MKLPAGKPELIASKNDVHEHFGALYLRGQYIEVTDSYIIARVPIERGGDDTDGPISRYAFELARRGKSDLLAENGTVALVDKRSGDRIELRRPEIKKEIPTLDSLKKKAEKPVYEVCLDAARLHQLAKALGADGVRLRISDNPRAAIGVLPLRGGDGEGLLMPILGGGPVNGRKS